MHSSGATKVFESLSSNQVGIHKKGRLLSLVLFLWIIIGDPKKLVVFFHALLTIYNYYHYYYYCCYYHHSYHHSSYVYWYIIYIVVGMHLTCAMVRRWEQPISAECHILSTIGRELYCRIHDGTIAHMPSFDHGIYNMYIIYTSYVYYI